MTDELAAILKEKTLEPVSAHPTLFALSNPTDAAEVKRLLETKEILHVLDDFEEQHRELFGLQHPTEVYVPGFEEKFQSYYTKLAADAPRHERGVWFYFPWRATLSHILDETDFFSVRTARNRNLITHEEQEKYYNATVGIGGLSVGSSIAFALVLQGGPKHLKLADMDRLALSNTNRVLAGMDRLGVLKVEMAARTIYELNPYAQIELYPEGISQENIDQFFEGLDIMIDELDNLSVKYLIRQAAQKYKVPVLMAADNGDNGVVDIERYDLTPDMPYFHGRMGETSYDELRALDKFGIGKMITKLVGPENVTVRMQESLLEMGKTIVSWPQLGGAALLNGSAVAYCARKVLTGEDLEMNRALVSLDEKLIPNYHSPEAAGKRTEAAESFKKIFGL